MRAIKYGKIEAVRVMTAVDEVDLEVKDNQGRDLEEFASWSMGWQSLIFPWTVNHSIIPYHFYFQPILISFSHYYLL